MIPPSDTDSRISSCLRRIEMSLGWGNSDNWTNYDFSKLSEEVHKRTQVQLSVTTLKRVWGRLKYDHEPALATLNALAQFAGFEDWRHFCKEDTSHSITEQSDGPSNAAPWEPARPKRIGRYWAFALIPILVPVVWILSPAEKEQIPNPNEFEFTADKMVTEGVPNSVVFHYNAEAAKTDSVFIVQTWDMRRKKLVSRSNHEHSAMYYYPGFFRTKLIADGSVVKTHDLWITSDGWLALVEQDPVPLYFRKEEYVFEDRIEVTPELLGQYNLSMHPSAPHVRIFNQRDLGDIMTDNFVFETNIKSDFRDGTGACQSMAILLQCKDDVIVLPLGSKACVGEMMLYFCGAHFPATDADLSGFGCDLSQWTNLRVESVNKQVKIFVNNKQAFELDFPNDPTGIVGVQYRFNGVGAVSGARFEKGGAKIALN